MKVGQWVDVKDTINQWLEAQVVEIRDNKAYIHYNGWGTRWDEWIEMNSPRIALFRTHTIQAATSTYLSPFPNTPPDTEENVLLSSPSVTSMNNLSKITELSGVATSMMNKLKTMRNSYDRRMKIQRQKVEEEYKRRSMKKRVEETKSKYYDKELEKHKVSENEEEDEEEKIEFKKDLGHREEAKHEISELEDEMSKKDLQKMINDNAQLHQQIMVLSGQLAPIMDRVGRLFTDFSPHLVYDVNSFNNDVRPRPNRNEEHKRNRVQQNDRQRNRSQENSRAGDLEDFDDELSNSSDTLSRNSLGSQDREGRSRDPNRDTNGIRTRLRSLSNTISQIRSSISSMRNLIFNNLGRQDQEENVNDELNIDQRGSNQMTVNVQVPIISSPGDIASVHNIFDRFVDRQIVNIIGGEGNANGPNRQNRNNANNANNTGNQNTQANANANANTESNSTSNRGTEQNNSSGESNTEGNNANRNNRGNRPNIRNDPLAELSNGIGGPGLGLGLITQALGGTGAFGGSGSDTIELHVHAFMPSNRDEPNGNIASNTIINNISSNNANNGSSLIQPQNILSRIAGSEPVVSNNRNQESNNRGSAQLRMSSEHNILSMSSGIQDRTESTNTIGPNRFEDKGVQTDNTRPRRNKRQRLLEREYSESSNMSIESGRDNNLRRNHNLDKK